MPTLCNMRTNLPLPDVPLKSINTRHKSDALGPHASKNPPDPHWLPSYSLVRETHGSLSQYVSFSFIDVGNVLTSYVLFFFSAQRGCPIVAWKASLQLQCFSSRDKSACYVLNLLRPNKQSHREDQRDDPGATKKTRLRTRQICQICCRSEKTS
eukprot:1144438-Pelagomonas_calceolata.AAC.1